MLNSRIDKVAGKKEGSVTKEYDMAEETRFQNILLEEIQGSLKLLAEGIAGLGERMDRLEHRMDRLEQRMDRLERRMDGVEHRMSSFEAAVLQHNQDIFNLRKAVNQSN